MLKRLALMMGYVTWGPMTQEFAHYYRYLWAERGLVVVMGDARPLVALREAYMARYDIPVTHDASVYANFDTFLAAVGLAAVSLPERESWGWSANFPGSETGFFVAAEPEGMMCGSLRSTVKDGSGAMVQRQAVGMPMTQSFFEPDSVDPVEAVQTYFDVAVQTVTRVVVPSLEHALLLQALPHGKIDDLWNLPAEELLACVQVAKEKGDLDFIDEVLLFYECRCSPDWVDQKMRTLPESQWEDIWDEEGLAVIECPRCTRNFTLRKM